LSSEREAAKAAFLAAHGFAAAHRAALRVDASTRSYERLTLADGQSYIFMDQPPNLETAPCPPEATPAQRIALGFNAAYRVAAGRVDAFVAVAGWLRAQGLSAPTVIAADPAAGLAVLEDLGDDLYAALIATGANEALLYNAAIDALLTLHQATPPPVLYADGSTWPLLTYDDLALKTAQDLFVEWLPKLKPVSFDAAALAAWEAAWAPIRARGEAGASVFCHRDYHAETLFWMPARDGAARVGLLDFQDALIAHPAWDLSMLLHDARRDVSAERETACLDRYLGVRLEVDPTAFLADYHALGALNIVRILGIFARLVTRDGKPRYAAFMPRLWTYLDRCLADPSLSELKAWFDAYVPVEARA
jgi:aminoglycoside/choline kinase family phosphotransferase